VDNPSSPVPVVVAVQEAGDVGSGCFDGSVSSDAVASEAGVVVNGCEVGWLVGAALGVRDEVVCAVGSGLSAEVADAGVSA
jgi:hypothetical protein